MKISFFNESRIRLLLQSPTYAIIYEKGIAWFKKHDPWRTEDVYRASVTLYTIKRCKEIWSRYLSIEDEYDALDEFLDRVKRGAEFRMGFW